MKLTKGEKTREALLLAGVRLFEKREYYSVSLTEVAKASGITASTIYEYFQDKEELYMACCEKAIDEARAFIDSRINERMAAEERLRAFLEANLLIASEHPEWITALLAIFHFGHFKPRMGNLQIRFEQQAVERIDLHLAQGVREGAWRCERPQEVAMQIHSLLIGQMIKQYSGSFPPKGKKGRASLELLWASVKRLLD